MALTYTPLALEGQSCPDFQLPGVDGRTYSRGDFLNGKPLLVLFICNHCPYVKAIEDRLIQLGTDLKRLDVNMVAICSNDPADYPEDSFENLRKRYFEKQYSFYYLHDEPQAVAKSFGAVCTPDFFLYSPDLKLQYRGRLDDSWKDPEKVAKRELYDAVLSLLKNEPLAQQYSSMGCSIKWRK